jgi:hypothetical protein
MEKILRNQLKMDIVTPSDKLRYKDRPYVTLWFDTGQELRESGGAPN